MLELNPEKNGVVRLRGRLDAAEAERALATLEKLPGPLTLDCTELEHISSAGLSVIVRTYKRLSAQASSLSVVGVMPRVRNVFVYAGLDKLLGIR